MVKLKSAPKAQETVLSSEEFRAAFRDHPAGVAVITADAGSGPVALTASSVASVSAEPPLIMFSVSEMSSSTPTIRQAKTVVVHLLGADQVHIAKLGATSGIDRFADRSVWDVLPTGETYFPGARTWIRARVIDLMLAGGSAVLLVEALEAKPADEASSEPLVYHNRTWHRLGDHSRID
ncbi:flavin reductase family protein [Herbiconiux sp.]|jgi:flavin reductase (DIM6/NTAB) family NADH-FMN oxidoreductase RutF|uniref:flavin reductase family protein n=1 Tax=Herbiconiux sp. TaxID=1871186 RepID=UPI0025B85578|nr:flavin reductase family protein [Herbiconiux sp.]